MIKAIFLAAFAAVGYSVDVPIKLTPLNITAGSVTVSGLSSGAFMAVQVHIAHSALIKGAGVFAGGPYYCAKGSLTWAEEQCMYYLMGGPDADKLVQFTETAYSQKKIDNPHDMTNHKVFLFSGTKDSVVDPRVVKTAEDYYGHFVSKTNIATDYNLAAQHCLPTLNYGEACTKLSSPYIGDCSHDGAGLALQHLYGSLTRGSKITSNLKAFDQTDFFSGVDTSLGDTGYIYIPTACQSGNVACRLHLSFHGCSQDLADIGNDYALNTGFNEWAEANNIVVVYPYAVKNTHCGNLNACWDWWGYTDANYVYQSGVQIKFVKSIIDTVMGTA